MNVTYSCAKCGEPFEVSREYALKIEAALRIKPELKPACPRCSIIAVLGGQETLTPIDEVGKEVINEARKARIITIGSYLMQFLRHNEIRPDEDTRLALKLVARTVEIGTEVLLDEERLRVELDFLIADADGGK